MSDLGIALVEASSTTKLSSSASSNVSARAWSTSWLANSSTTVAIDG